MTGTVQEFCDYAKKLANLALLQEEMICRIQDREIPLDVVYIPKFKEAEDELLHFRDFIMKAKAEL